MPYTILNVFLPHGLNCEGHQSLMALLSQTDKFLCSQTLEYLLDFAENQFYWIVLR